MWVRIPSEVPKSKIFNRGLNNGKRTNKVLATIGNRLDHLFDWESVSPFSTKEDCQSGLFYLFAKEAGITAPQVRILYLPLPGKGESNFFIYK